MFSFNPDVDFQQRQMLLNNQQQHQIKSEEFGSPPPAGRSPLEASPPKMGESLNILFLVLKFF